MKQFHKIFLTILFAGITNFSLLAQNRFFADAAENKISTAGHRRTIVPQKYRTVNVNPAELKTFLWSLPAEKNVTDRKLAPVMDLPMPDGSIAKFRVWESSIQEPGLETKFPEIKTFLGQGIDDPFATLRFDYTDFGFHAQILSVHGNIYIDPYARGDINNYITYYSRDEKRDDPWVCQVAENLGTKISPSANVVPVGQCRGTQLNTYRLAVACTGEYAVAVGGTTPALLHSAIVTTVNRVVGVYEVELSVRMVLIANNNIIEFLDPATDPFNGNDDAGTLINESQTVITAMIGNANFDIGHTFSTGGGGLAGLGVVCQNGQKASGITGSPNPVGDGYDIDYVAHEMGHEFGADHPFNSSASNCGGGNRNGPTAYEVGSGTSIMAYAGICGSDDIQPHSDPTFHTVSFDEISVYLQGAGGGCAVITPTGNNLPQITSMPNNNLSIPANTPFTLTATATDPDGDALTYCWEEWDLGPSTTWNGGTANATSPLFKSRLPKTSGERTFPDPARIAANYLPVTPPAVMDGLKGETLPITGRTMKFRLTVRDNHAGGGGVVTGGNGCQTGYTGTYSLTAVSGNPFAVTVPNGGESYGGGTTQTVTWNVVGTDAAPFNVANVKISLSTDGGLTFPTVLLASTPNDGSEPVTIPAVVSTTARIKVEALANVFFDISNANFIITAASNGFVFNSVAGASVPCSGPASADVTLTTTVTGSFSTPINLSAAGNPAGTTVSFSTNPLTPGSTTTITLTGLNTLAAGSYDITVTGTAGAVTQTSTLTYTVQPGAPPAVTTQPAPASVCSGSNVTFTAASSTPGVSYQWQVSNGGGPFTDIAGATSATYSFTASQADDGNLYHCIISYLCGTASSNDAALTVNTAANITTQPAGATVCSGDAHTFTVAATGSNVSYQWQVSVNGTGVFTDIPGETNASLTLTGISNAMNGNVYQVVITATGSTCPAPGISSPATLTVNPTPVVTASADATTVCSGSAVQLTATGAGSYTWQPGNLSGSMITVNPEVLSSAPGSPNPIDYTVTGTSTGCSASATVTVTANPLPAVMLEASPSNTNLTLPTQTVTLTANVSPPGSAYMYSWTQNGLPIANTSNTLTVDLSQVGEYAVTVSLNQGCASQSNKITIVDSVADRFYIYPNPNDGRFSIQVRLPNNIGNVTVFDSKGARVFAQVNIESRSNFQVISVDLRPANSGVYVLAVYDKSGERMISEKIVVKH